MHASASYIGKLFIIFYPFFLCRMFYLLTELGMYFLELVIGFLISVYYRKWKQSVGLHVY